MKLPEFGVRRPIFTAIIFVSILILGLVALRLLSIDLFPKMELPTMAVITSYPGASAEDIEAKVTDLRDRVEILEGLQAGELGCGRRKTDETARIGSERGGRG